MSDPNTQPDPGVADTAKKLAEQTIDAAGSVVELAKDIPVDTAKLLLSQAKKLVSKLEDVLD